MAFYDFGLWFVICINRAGACVLTLFSVFMRLLDEDTINSYNAQTPTAIAEKGPDNGLALRLRAPPLLV
jgi:hypothetical protein